MKAKLIGSTWTDSKGRTWEVLEMVNPGKYRVGVMVATESGGRVAIRIVPSGGRAGWDDISVAEWFRWFTGCLMTKINRVLPSFGKGSKAARRAKAMADAKAECKWCGQKTGDARKEFCSGECRRDCYS